MYLSCNLLPQSSPYSDDERLLEIFVQTRFFFFLTVPLKS